jgi:hypothetical protein
MLRVAATLLLLSASIPAGLAGETKTKDAAHPPSTPSHVSQGPYGALPPIAPEKNKPKADPLAGQLLQLGASRLEADALSALPQTSPGVARRPRAFDASEGTALDPLRNDTFDLTHPHAVPSLR